MVHSLNRLDPPRNAGTPSSSNPVCALVPVPTWPNVLVSPACLPSLPPIPLMLIPAELLEDRIQHYESRLADQEAHLNQVAAAQWHHQTPIVSLPTPQNTHQTMTLPSIRGPSDLTNPLDISFPSASPSGLSTASFPDPHVLPSPDIVQDLIALFYMHIHCWAPILSPTQPNFHAPWNIVVHAIVVVTLRLSSDPRLEGRKESYKCAAKQHVLRHAIESTSISSVQALALLAIDLIGSDQGPSSWGILALLTRSAVHLGLAAEDDQSAAYSRAPAPSLSRTSVIPPAADWAEHETRRRLFWLIFALDRYACVSTGWDFALPDYDIRRRLPCADEIWIQPVSLPYTICAWAERAGPARSRMVPGPDLPAYPTFSDPDRADGTEPACLPCRSPRLAWPCTHSPIPDN